MHNKHISEIHFRFSGHQDHLKLLFFLSTLVPILFPSFQLLLPLQPLSVCWGACSREGWKQRLVFNGKMDPFFLSETLKLSHAESIFWLSSMVKWPFLKVYLGHNYVYPQFCLFSLYWISYDLEFFCYTSPLLFCLVKMDSLCCLCFIFIDGYLYLL